jgi:orotate phosphoribosyltransferase
MVKKDIYEELLQSKIIKINEVPTNNDIPYVLSFNKIISNPTLFDNITLLAENSINAKEINFNKLCASSTSAIPYATNIATSFKKGLIYIDSTGHDSTEKGNVMNLKVEGDFVIDDNIIVVETINKKNYLLQNIIKKLRKFGGNVVGVVIILDICEGEIVELIDNKEPLIKVLNIYDIFNHYENNNMIDMFCSERLKFYCEKETKVSIKKLTDSKIEIEREREREREKEKETETDNNKSKSVECSSNTTEIPKQIFVGQ